MHTWDQLLQLPPPDRSRRVSYSGHLPAGESKNFFLSGPGCVRHWWFTYMCRDAQEQGGQDILTAVHQVRLRIHFDGHATPAVDQPLDTFFGTFLDLSPVEVSSLPITVLKRNGFNSWFPMPFAERCEFVLVNENALPMHIWFMADYHEFAPDAPLAALRFRADYRNVDPGPDYGFLETAQLEGQGFIAGIFHGTDARSETDAWFHTGGDTWLLDGETRPHLIRGNGGEDLVGYSFGIYESNYPWQGAPYVQPREGGGANSLSPCIFYRFFGPDAIVFKYSAIAKFGTKAMRVETNIYSYTDAAPAPACVTIADWHLCGPFDGRTREAFDRAEFPETEPPSDRTFSTDLPAWQPHNRRPVNPGPYVGRWVPMTSKRGWVDFLDCFRGINYANEATSGQGGAAYALGHFHSDSAVDVTLLLSCDDWAKVWLNGLLVDRFEHDAGFATRRIPVRLQAGDNRILIKLSNAVNLEFFAWAFNLRVEMP